MFKKCYEIWVMVRYYSVAIATAFMLIFALRMDYARYKIESKPPTDTKPCEKVAVNLQRLDTTVTLQRD